MIPNPPQQIAFAVDVEGAFLNVFLQGAFAGQMPLLAVESLMFSPADELAFVPESDLMFA